MKVFISYARADKAVVDVLVADVRSLGHLPFYDSDLTGGQRWWDALLDHIEECDVFVPVLSDEYRDSVACHAEASWARDLGVPFMPIMAVEQSPGLYDPVIAEANWVVYDPESRGSLADLARGLSTTPAVTPPDVVPDRPEIPLTYLTAIDRQLRQSAEIGRGQQLTLISDLKSRLGTRDEKGARELLASLRARPEITFEAATTIDELLRGGRSEQARPSTATTPTAAAPQPARAPSAPSSPPTPPPSPSAARPARMTPESAPATAETGEVPRAPSGQRPGPWAWAGAGLALVGSALAVVAVLGPWTSVSKSSIEYGLLPESSNRIPGAVGVVAVLAVVVAILVALVSRVVRMPLRIRILAAAYDVVVAFLGLLGTQLITDHAFDEPLWGSRVLALALVLLAVVMLLPPLRQAQQRPVTPR